VIYDEVIVRMQGWHYPNDPLLDSHISDQRCPFGLHNDLKRAANKVKLPKLGGKNDVLVFMDPRLRRAG
jgi:hypothetical protein